MKHKNLSLVIIFILGVFIQNLMAEKLQSGELLLTISQEHKQDNNLKVKINSRMKTPLELTQSSKIKIQAKLIFSNSQFKPQFFSFRLRHPLYENLSEPVLTSYNRQNDVYTINLDLGDPKQIKPYSDKYQLEVILADQKLDKNIRNVIADCNVKFRKSWETIPSSDLHYKTQNIIQTSAPTQRIDPPRTFTLFIVLLIIAIDGLFIYGLNYLKVNIKLFPKTSSGVLVNFVLLILLTVNLFILIKFWINWTFLETLKYVLILLIPTSLVANYALVHVSKN